METLRIDRASPGDMLISKRDNEFWQVWLMLSSERGNFQAYVLYSHERSYITAGTIQRVYKDSFRMNQVHGTNEWFVQRG